MPQNKLMGWLLGFFASAALGLGTWSASSLSSMQAQMPLIGFRLAAVEAQLADLNRANRDGARFTAQDGLDLTTFVRRLEARIIAIEQRLPGTDRVEHGKGG